MPGPPDVLEWVREFAPRSIPEQLPQPRPLPTVEQVLTVLRDAGCRWDPWYEITGLASLALPSSGLYLGEVSIKVESGAEHSGSVRLDDLVVGLSFRKPGEGLVRAVAVLVKLGGHQLVFDTFGQALVVSPDDGGDGLAETWLW